MENQQKRKRNIKGNGGEFMTKKVDSLFKHFKSKNLLEDRREYDEEEYLKSYPGLTKKEAGQLHRKVQKWAWR